MCGERYSKGPFGAASAPLFLTDGRMKIMMWSQGSLSVNPL